MRIVLAPVGTRSDVIPFYSLAVELQRRNHIVLLCIPETYRSEVMRLGFQMVSSGRSFDDLLENPEGAGDQSAKLVESLKESLPMQFVSLRDALREADVLVGAMLLLAGPSMAEKKGIPYFYMVSSPTVLDAELYPSVAVSKSKYEGLLGSMRRNSNRKKWEDDLRETLNRERGFSALPAVKDLGRHAFHSGKLLLAYDSSLTEVPESQNATGTGFWFFDQTNPIDDQLREFMSAGDAPIFVDAIIKGETAMEHARAITNALNAAGFRVLLSSDWGIPKAEMKGKAEVIDALVIPQVLPHVKAAIHRGNVFMTGECFRFAVPQIVIPDLIDQHHWAAVVEKSGAGIMVSGHFNTTTIVDRAKRLLADESVKNRARSLSEKVKDRNGVSVAADLIEENAGA